MAIEWAKHLWSPGTTSAAVTSPGSACQGCLQSRPFGSCLFRVSLCRPGWPGILYIDQTGLELIKIFLRLPPTSWVKDKCCHARSVNIFLKERGDGGKKEKKRKKKSPGSVGTAGMAASPADKHEGGSPPLLLALMTNPSRTIASQPSIAGRAD